MEENWKDVPDYEEHYQASTFGNVRSMDRIDYRKNNSDVYTPHNIKGKILKQKTTKRGYKAVILCKDGIIKHTSVHRIICLTFHSNTESKKMVNHIDGDKSNNRIENLEWCTAKENSQHAVKTGLQKPILGEKNYNAAVTDAQVIEIREKYKNGISRNDLAIEYGVAGNRIYEIVVKRVYKHIA